MSCPFSEFELDMFDGVVNPMGEPCNTCYDYECEHNNNEDNPEWLFDGSGEPMTPKEFAESNKPDNPVKEKEEERK